MWRNPEEMTKNVPLLVPQFMYEYVGIDHFDLDMDPLPHTATMESALHPSILTLLQDPHKTETINDFHKSSLVLCASLYKEISPAISRDDILME